MGPYALETCGAWINILCCLFWNGGKQTKSIDEWARVLRENRKKTEKILEFLEKKGIADFERLDNQNVTITSRRMVRDFRISQLRTEVGKLGGNPGLKKIKENREILDNQNDNQKDQSSVSVSSSDNKDTPISPSADEEKKEKPKKTKPPKTPIPENFQISDRVKRWAAEKHFTNLEDHLEYFKSCCAAKGYEYINWDDAFMNAIRGNWAKIESKQGGTGPRSYDDPNTTCPSCKKVVLKTDILNGKCFKCDPGGKNAGIGDLFKNSPAQH